jgi:L-alanine-DL-glutamate epimerase-like enolase superfamily enzyme
MYPGTAASMHVAASIPNFVIMEEGSKETAEYKDIFTGGWKATLSQWEVPNGPGLGVDISPEFLRDHEVKGEGG